MRDDEGYTHQRELQLMPVTGVYYRALASLDTTPTDPPYFLERVVALALVEHWRSRRGAEYPDEPTESQETWRRIEAVTWCGDYFETTGAQDDEDTQLLGYYFAEELDDATRANLADRAREKNAEWVARMAEGKMERVRVAAAKAEKA